MYEHLWIMKLLMFLMFKKKKKELPMQNLIPTLYYTYINRLVFTPTTIYLHFVQFGLSLFHSQIDSIKPVKLGRKSLKIILKYFVVSELFQLTSFPEIFCFLFIFIIIPPIRLENQFKFFTTLKFLTETDSKRYDTKRSSFFKREPDWIGREPPHRDMVRHHVQR